MTTKRVKAVKKTDKKTEETTKPAAETTNSPAPQEILVENEGKVGGILKQARLRQGKKLPDIAQSLCIRKSYLEAIEDSRYDAIPEPPYGLGFIRSYADYLGEDSAKIARMYKAETEAKFNGENKMYVLEPQEEANVPSKKYLLISLLAIMVIYFLWLAFTNYHNTVQNAPAEPANTETATPAEAEFPLVVEDYAPVEEAASEEESDTMLVSEPKEPEATSAEPEKTENKVIEVAPVDEVKNQQVVVNEGSFNEEETKVEPKEEVEAEPQAEKADEPAPVVAAPAPGKSNIVLKIKKETWVEVKNAEKLYLSKVLMPGTSYALPKADGLILSVGRVDGVDVFVGDQQVNIVKPNKKTNIVLEEALKNLNH